MALRKLVLAAVFVVGCVRFAGADELAAVANPQQLGFDPARLQRLGEVYKGFVDNGELPGAVLLVARGDKIAYFQTIGFQDRAKKTPMKADSIFRLASMTKPIVSVAAMMLVEEGKLDLMAPVSKYLPEFKDLKVGVEKTDAGGQPTLVLEPQKRPMIVQDLLRHTAGFVYGQFGDHLVHKMYRDAKIGDRGDTLAEMVTKLSKLPLAHQPGEVWEYSIAVDVLGRVIEVVSGKELDAFIAERVAKPLGMAATDFYVHEPDLPRLAEAQPPPSGSKGRMPPDVTKKPRLFSGGGGLVATAGDYLNFSEMLLNHGEFRGTRLLSPHTVALMTSDALPPGVGYSERALTTTGDIAPTPAMGQGFGLGFAVRTAAGHNPLPGSLGNYYWTGAWGTTFWIDPAKRLIAIQMIQTPSDQGGPYRRVFRELTYAALTGSEGPR